jgi:superfamily II DNA or RNA helicase
MQGGSFLRVSNQNRRISAYEVLTYVTGPGILIQYAGRLHRLNAAKKKVILYDYVDFEVPILAKMHARQRAAYKALGDEIDLPGANKPLRLALRDL